MNTTLDAMRSRAGILLSAAAIATSFLGGQALTEHDPKAWTWLAIASFVGLAISALVILWPRRDWAFAASPGLIISLYLEDDPPWQLSAIHRELALHMDHAYEVNRARLDHHLGVPRRQLAARARGWNVGSQPGRCNLT